MINLPVDECYAFDYLAILYVKNKLKENLNNISICETAIRNQIGNRLWFQILNSIEFKELIQINQKVFDAVEKARYGNISAKEVDSYNMQRFIQKIALQNKFFPNTTQVECKT